MRMLSGRFVIGLVVLVVGVLFLLNNLDIGLDINIGKVFSLWPVIPLVLGLNWLFLAFRSTGSETGSRVFFPWGQLITSLVATAVGVLFLGRNLGLFHFETRLFWSLFWPVILILVGFSLLRGRAASGGQGGRFTLMGEANIGGDQPWKLESGSYFAMMGGIKIDLGAAEIADGETVLDLTAFMAGIEVMVPKDLSVIYEGSAVLGGVTFKDQEDGGIIGGRRVEHNINGSTEKVVRIQARAIMGGVEIKEI